MATEPTNGELDEVHNAIYEVQLLNLGRIIENPSLIHLFSHEDFSDITIRNLIKVLKSKDKTIEAKNFHLKEYMKRRGVSTWGEESSECKKELFDTQRRQRAAEILAFNAVLAVDYLRTNGSVTNKDTLKKALDKVRELCDIE